jgi:cell wall-associated NlpC family hydrolase
MPKLCEREVFIHIMKKLLLAPTVALSLLLSTGAVVSVPASASAAEIYATHGDQVVRVAESYMGRVRYQFGVNDPAHLVFDCSSFTKFVFKQARGFYLPWGAGLQTRFGMPQSRANLAIGDLVMFSTSTPGKIGHVGIYIGGGRMISNMPRTGVSIQNINSSYWSKRFVTARHY